MVGSGLHVLLLTDDECDKHFATAWQECLAHMIIECDRRTSIHMMKQHCQQPRLSMAGPLNYSMRPLPCLLQGPSQYVMIEH